MIITSHGAARNVTGSRHILEVNGKRLLLDCGMFQGKRLESYRRNSRLSFDPRTIDAVILSHAHIDHSGVLPMLIKGGYRGRIYATPATRDLCAVMLLDSAHIQKKDAEWLSKKHREFMPPIYDDQDVAETLKRFISMPYEDGFDPIPGVGVTFHEAGHVLGSAMVELEYTEEGRARKLVFSGDIGRRNMPILNDPWQPTDADVVMMEATYGDRDHDPIDTRDAELAAVIQATCERGGKVIVPSFALERAQELVYALKRLQLKGMIPDVPVYVDSPLTVRITDIFRMHMEVFDTEIRHMIVENGDPFHLEQIRYISRVEDSMRLNNLRGPAVIISASGMCETGRILHHLRNNIEEPRNTILIIGFQAEYTLGRRIVERDPYVKIFGVKRPLRADVKVMNSFSAHAGRTELLEFGKRFKGRAEKILLVHGEDRPLTALQSALQAEGLDAHIMQDGQPVTV